MVEGWKEISLNEIGWFKGAGVNKLSNIDEHPVYLINYMDVYKHWQIYFNNNYQEVTAKEREKKEANLLVGDILFTPSSEKPIDIGHAGIIMEEMPDCVYSYHLIRYRLNDKSKFDMNFISYLLNSDEVQKHFVSRASGSGIRYTLSLNDFKSLKIRFPKKTEQASIANILSSVDEAIDSVKKSIEAAEKLKKSLMQNLLTGRMKPDGTFRTEEEFYEDEKFGKVPIGWEVKKGYEITNKITKGQSPKWQGFEYQNYGILFITSENIRNGYIDISNPKYLPIEFNNKIKNSQLSKGDILINIVGASIGRCAVYNMNINSANTNQAVCVFRPNSDNDSLFLSLYLQDETTQKRLFRTQVETARANLSLGDFRKFKFIIPQKDEQIEISKKINQFNDIITNKQNQIITLERLKKSLMQNLLTGKVRVGDGKGKKGESKK